MGESSQSARIDQWLLAHLLDVSRVFAPRPDEREEEDDEHDDLRHVQSRVRHEVEVGKHEVEVDLIGLDGEAAAEHGRVVADAARHGRRRVVTRLQRNNVQQMSRCPVLLAC